MFRVITRTAKMLANKTPLPVSTFRHFRSPILSARPLAHVTKISFSIGTMTDQHQQSHLNALLREALDKADLQLANRWIAEKADINAIRFQNRYDAKEKPETALMHCFGKLNGEKHDDQLVTELKLLISSVSRENLNEVNAGGCTVLHDAAFFFPDEIIIKLLECGANPNIKQQYKNQTAYDVYKSRCQDRKETPNKEVVEAFIKYMKLSPVPEKKSQCSAAKP